MLMVPTGAFRSGAAGASLVASAMSNPPYELSRVFPPGQDLMMRPASRLWQRAIPLRALRDGCQDLAVIAEPVHHLEGRSRSYRGRVARRKAAAPGAAGPA